MARRIRQGKHGRNNKEQSASRLPWKERICMIMIGLMMGIRYKNIITVNNMTSIYASFSETIQQTSASAIRKSAAEDLSKEQGPPPDFHAKIVAFSDINFIPIAIKWYNRMTELGYNEHVIAALDVMVYEKLKQDNYRVDAAFIENPERRNFVKGFMAQLLHQRLRYVKEQLQRGIHLLLTDADNVFMKYVPIWNFYQEGYDVIHAYEITFPEFIYRQFGMVVCGGHEWLRASNATIRFMNMVLNQCNTLKSKCNDQIAFNQALFNHGQVEWDGGVNPHHADLPRLNWDNDKINCGQLVKGLSGRSRVTNHTFKIWDRDFAWRLSEVPLSCPKDNWVAMPTKFSDQNGVPAVSRGRVQAKLHIMDRWMELCHPQNGTLIHSPAPPIVTKANITCTGI